MTMDSREECHSMPTKDHVLSVVFRVIDSVNHTLPDEHKLSKSESTVLLGDGGTLDSLGLVMFVVRTEQEIQDDFESNISLTDGRAMSQRNSPFRTVGTLVDYIEGALERKLDGE